jgi:hypothetical protein
MQKTKIDTAGLPEQGSSRRPSTFKNQMASNTRQGGRQDARSGAINDMGEGSRETRGAVTANAINRGARRRGSRHRGMSASGATTAEAK